MLVSFARRTFRASQVELDQPDGSVFPFSFFGASIFEPHVHDVVFVDMFIDDIRQQLGTLYKKRVCAFLSLVGPAISTCTSSPDFLKESSACVLFTTVTVMQHCTPSGHRTATGANLLR